MRRIKRAMLLILFLGLSLCPQNAAADTGKTVLIVYEDSETMAALSDMVAGMGHTPAAVRASAYEYTDLDGASLLVTQSPTALADAQARNKPAICIGFIPEAWGDELSHRQMGPVVAKVTFNNLTQTVIIPRDVVLLSKETTQGFGQIQAGDAVYALGIVNDGIAVVPYMDKDNLSLLAGAEAVKRMLRNEDDAEAFFALDAVYPFEDMAAIYNTAKTLHAHGIPFLVRVMPVYDHADYPAFTRFCDLLKRIQVLGGAMMMHAPIETQNALFGDTIAEKMADAMENYQDQGVALAQPKVFPLTVPYAWLASVSSTDGRSLAFPVDTLVTIDAMDLNAQNEAAVKILLAADFRPGDYRTRLSDGAYDIQIVQGSDEEYDYHTEMDVQTEAAFSTAMKVSNRVLTVIVIISGISVLVFIYVGYRLYINKFIKKK